MNATSKTRSKLLVTLGGNVGNQLFQLAGALTLVGGDFSKLLFDERFTYLCNGPQLRKIIDPRNLNVARKRDLISFGMWPFPCIKHAQIHHGFQKVAELSGTVRAYHSDPRENQRSAVQYSVESEQGAQVIGSFIHMKWVTGSSKFLIPKLMSRDDVLGSRTLGVSIRRRADYNGNRLPLRYYEDCHSELSNRNVRLDGIIITGDTADHVDLKVTSGIPCQNISQIPWHEQFVTLSNCEYSILSNSTFAWWAAWLSCNRRWPKSRTLPHTFYPSKWFDSSLTDIEGWCPMGMGDLW